MKHVLTSTGLLALGAVTLHAWDPEMTRQQTGRPFSLSATVRGFYDDNINTSPSHEDDSIGLEVSPSAHLNLPLEQTFISLGYVYSLKWYEDREPHDIDQSHEFNAKLRHQFSPRHSIGVDDSFVLSSEPSVVDQGGIVTAPTRLRSKGDVFHNLGSIEDNLGLNPTWSLSFGYVNSWYDYEAKGAGSRSALLDRMDHLFRLDLRHQFQPKLIGLVGYTFGLNQFTGDDFIYDDATRPTVPNGLGNIKSDFRDNYAHYGYVGADFDITAKLRASARVGVQYSDYHESGESEVNPYVDASVSYLYNADGSVELGVRHSRSATDVSQFDTTSGRPTLDAETTAVYGQLSHRITHGLTASLMAQYQLSTFNDGENDGDNENLLLLGVNLEYRFDRHWSTEVGYNFDTLDSDVDGREYDRNRVYVGVRASY